MTAKPPDINEVIKLKNIFGPSRPLAIIPLLVAKKIPAQAWKSAFEEGPWSDDKLRAIWRQRGHELNPGIATGPLSGPGLVVVDGDNAPALAWMREHLPPTPMRTVTRHGEHWYYRHPQGVDVGNRSDVLGSKKRFEHDAGAAGFDVRLHPKASPEEQAAEKERAAQARKSALAAGVEMSGVIDVRGRGGQVVAPGALHPSGFRYAQAEPWRADMDLPTFDPAWFEGVKWQRPQVGLLDSGMSPAALLASRQRERWLTEARENTTGDEKMRRARGYLATIEGAVGGAGGHDKLFYAACRLVKGFLLSPEDALALLLSDYNSRCSPEWTYDEVAHKVEDAVKQLGAEDGYLLTPRSGPPEIQLTLDELATTKQVAPLLARVDGIYQRGGSLVDVVVEPRPSTQGIHVPLARIRTLPTAQLRMHLTAQARYVRAKRVKKGDETELVGVPLPDHIVKQVESMGQWADVAALRGLVRSPLFLEDGRIVSTSGYDVASGLYLAGEIPAVQVAELPTKDDAEAALRMLTSVVGDFPFTQPTGPVAFVAMLLTPLTRYAHPGSTPLMLAEAASPGTGKTLLVDAVSTIVTGHPAPKTDYPAEPEELRKKITTLLLDGENLIVFDNVDAPLGGSALELVMTTPVWKDRALGSNSSVTLPVTAVFYATANNVRLRGDMARRVLAVRLETNTDTPEERTGFRHPDLLAVLRQERPKLLAAALTLLRAYHVAGRPAVGLTSWGSFTSWSDHVRAPIVWAGGADPIKARIDVIEQGDTERDGAARIVRALFDVFGYAAFTSAEVVREANPHDSSRQSLVDALDEACPRRPGQRVDTQIVARALRKLRGRVFGGLRLKNGEGRSNAGTRWCLEGVNDAKPI